MVTLLTVARRNVIISQAKCLCLDIFSCFDFRHIIFVRQKFNLIIQSNIHRAKYFLFFTFSKVGMFSFSALFGFDIDIETGNGI